MLLYYGLAALLPFICVSNAQSSVAPAPSFAPGGTWPSNLVGTWSTKSRSTITGPVCAYRRLKPFYLYTPTNSLLEKGFYNPNSDEFIEPDHTGVRILMVKNFSHV